MLNIERAALAATLALAMLPALAIATAAHAAPHAVQVADLDLATPQGAAEFEARLDKAARAYCAERKVTGSRMIDRGCIEAVRQEIGDKAKAMAARPAGDLQAAVDSPVASR